MDNEEKIIETEEAVETEKTAEKEKVSKKKEKSEKNGSGALGKVLVLALMAIVCVGLIVVAILTKKKGGDDSESAVSEDTVSAPTLSDVDPGNVLTEEECKANVESGIMKKATTEAGATIYYFDYNNTDYISGQIACDPKEIDEMVETYILPNFTDIVDADHEDVREGDIANIDFLGKVDGVAFEGGAGEGYELEIGSGTFIPGFEDQLIGMNIGDTKDIEVTFPDEYVEDLAGKDAVFTVSVNSILVEVKPTEPTDDMVDQFFAGYGYDIHTVKEMKEFFKNDKEGSNLSELIFDSFYISAINESLIDDYYAEYDNYMKNTAANNNLSEEELLSYYGMTLEESEAYGRQMAVESARVTELVKLIADIEGITITDEDIDNVVLTLGYMDRASYEADFGKDDPCLQYYALQDKVMEFVFKANGLTYSKQ